MPSTEQNQRLLALDEDDAAANPEEYQKLLEDELLPKAQGDWRIGKEKFARKLEFELDAGLTAEQVLREAESEAERVERDMYVIARQLWGQKFPKIALPPDDADGRRLTIRRVITEVGKEHGKVEALVADVRTTVERIKKFITERDILRLPDPDRCQIIEMPEFQRGFSTAYLNPAPPLDARALLRRSARAARASPSLGSGAASARPASRRRFRSGDG